MKFIKIDYAKYVIYIVHIINHVIIYNIQIVNYVYNIYAKYV